MPVNPNPSRTQTQTQPQPQQPTPPSQPRRTNPALETRKSDTTSSGSGGGGGGGGGSFTLLLFASASSYTGGLESLRLPAPTTLPALLDELERRHPGIGAKVLRACQLAVNLQYVDVDVADVVGGRVDARGRRVGEEVTIRAGDEVAVVPPVSSG